MSRGDIVKLEWKSCYAETALECDYDCGSCSMPCPENKTVMGDVKEYYNEWRMNLGEPIDL